MDHQTTAGHAPANSNNRSEAERLLGIAEKLLQTRDLTGSREFAMLAQETEPLLEGSDQILAITDVLLASERRVSNSNTTRHPYDWYSILQLNDRRSDVDVIKKNYRRLALLLHPDKNHYPLADSAFKLVADAWATLFDTNKRATFDQHLNVSSKVDLRPNPPPATPQHPPQQQDKDKLPVRRSPRAPGTTTPTPIPGGNTPAPAVNANTARRTSTTPATANFWTACPYCYVLYEFPKVYEECCLRCQNCERAFHAAVIPSLPPIVPGKEAYYCCWGFFPLGFELSSKNNKGKDTTTTTTTHAAQTAAGNNANNNVNVNNNNVNVSNNNNNNNANNNNNSGFPNWMPGMFTATPVSQGHVPNMNVNVVDGSDGSASAGFGNIVNVAAAPGFTVTMANPGPKKRGRPRKNPV